MVLTLGLGNACSLRESALKTSADFASAVGLTADPVLQEKALAILDQNCASCHLSSAQGGLSQINNPESLVSQGWIKPGSSATSTLFTAIQAGRMPPTGPLATQDQTIIGEWIDSMKMAATPTPTTSPTPSDNSLEGQAVQILTNLCLACHGTSGSGGVSQINSPDHLRTAGLVSPGNPGASTIMTAITNRGMPPSGSLPANEIATLEAWITAGAKTPAGFTAPTPTPFPSDPTFSNVLSAVLSPRCVSCHGPTQAADGIRLDTYAAVKRYVSTSSPSSSKLLRVMSSGEMPPSSPVENQEYNLVVDWIGAGAPNN